MTLRIFLHSAELSTNTSQQQRKTVLSFVIQSQINSTFRTYSLLLLEYSLSTFNYSEVFKFFEIANYFILWKKSKLMFAKCFSLETSINNVFELSRVELYRRKDKTSLSRSDKIKLCSLLTLFGVKIHKKLRNYAPRSPFIKSYWNVREWGFPPEKYLFRQLCAHWIVLVELDVY